MRIWGRLIGPCVVAAMLVLGLHPPTLAAPVAPVAPTARPAAPVKVLIVLDVSGSMAASAGNGQTRLDAARNALADLARALPPQSSVGLRVYGAKYAGKNRKISCRDTQLVAPIAKQSPQKLIGAARRLRPTGDTPIALALKYGASDLDESPLPGKKVMLLISDGQDNCSAPSSPPCQVVRGLKDQGLKVRIETVGVSLQRDPAARNSLECLSKATGGRYYDAKNAPSIAAAIERISGETLQELGLGQKVGGAAKRTAAPVIGPGTYQFQIRPGQTAWFRFKAGKGARPTVLATVDGVDGLRVPPANRNCPSWRAELLNPYGEGGLFPPYGNSGSFDGVGIGSTGVSTTKELDPYSQGIDFTGTWGLKFTLAKDTLDSCSSSLPRRPYQVRFRLATSASDLSGSTPSGSGTASPSASPSSASSASPSDPSKPDAAIEKKYNEPAEPSSGPSWLPAVVAAACALAALGCLAFVIRARRRRLRGW